MTQLTSLKHLSADKKISSLDSSDENSSASAISSSSTNVNVREQEARMKHKMQRQKTRRNMNKAVQRPDLGTVHGTKAIDKPKEENKPGLMGGFVGSISSIFFGRKGGFL
jgi:hypothetical protein